jgi:hypothetical protein
LRLFWREAEKRWNILEHLGTSLEVHEGLVRLTSEEILLVLPLLDLIPALGTVEVAIPSVGRNAVMDVAMNKSGAQLQSFNVTRCSLFVRTNALFHRQYTRYIVHQLDQPRSAI